MHVLEDLWYGKVAPIEEPVYQNSEYAKVLQQITKEQEALKNVLPQEEKYRLESYDDAQIKFLDVAERSAFIMGFRLGARTILDVLSDEKV